MDIITSQQVTVAITMIIGYLLGALPIAERISRRNGIDLFHSGTGLAGASNVRRTVGKRAGAIVMLADFAKGLAAIMLARGFGLDGGILLLIALSTIIGHWNSIFSRFRGGDGMTSLAGVTVGLFPAFGYLSLLGGGIFSILGHKLPHHALLAIVAAYCTILAAGIVYNADPTLIIGTGMLSALVLGHATWGHITRHRRHNATNNAIHSPQDEVLHEQKPEIN